MGGKDGCGKGGKDFGKGGDKGGAKGVKSDPNERRRAPDGNFYTRQQFIAQYGKWQ
eukprot:gene816-3970_t